MSRLFRSLIFVPGNNKRFLEKAKNLSADIVCFDLEDSVPESEKEKARKLIVETLKERKDYLPEVYVRTNSPASQNIRKDLHEIIRKGLDGIVVPKVNDARELKKIEKTISSLEKKRKLKSINLIPSIESAEGVFNTFQIASSSRRISALIFGVFDLLHDIGIEYTKQPEGAKFARSKLPIEARAAGVYVIDAIWQDLNDFNGLKEDCHIGKSLGYVGKSIIHPDQIEIANEIFYPTKTEIDWSKKVYQIYKKSSKKGKGAILVDGKMIDEVHYKRAKAILDLTNQ